MIAGEGTGCRDRHAALHARAARDALTRERLAEPRADGAREELRVLLVARYHHVRMRTATVNTFKAFVLTAPEPLQTQFRGLGTAAEISHAAELPAGENAAEEVLMITLAQLAGVVRLLDEHLAANKTQLAALVSSRMPEMLAKFGVGPVAAAQLLVSWSHPGRCRSAARVRDARRHRTLTRLVGPGHASPAQPRQGPPAQPGPACHRNAPTPPRPPHPATTPTDDKAAGSTDRETRHCLKNYLARHLWRVMEHHQPEPYATPTPPTTDHEPGLAEDPARLLLRPQLIRDIQGRAHVR